MEGGQGRDPPCCSRAWRTSPESRNSLQKPGCQPGETHPSILVILGEYCVGGSTYPRRGVSAVAHRHVRGQVKGERHGIQQRNRSTCHIQTIRTCWMYGQKLRTYQGNVRLQLHSLSGTYRAPAEQRPSPVTTKERPIVLLLAHRQQCRIWRQSVPIPLYPGVALGLLFRRLEGPYTSSSSGSRP